jgi:hypothetical protein
MPVTSRFDHGFAPTEIMMVRFSRVSGRIGAGLVLLLSPLSPASAAVAHGSLSLRQIESELPADPLLASSDPMWTPHVTPAAWLADARLQLAQALPRGTALSVAQQRLRLAGARCRMAGENALSCGYHWIETRDEYVDDVRWKVDVSLADGKVDHVAVARAWTRH